MVVFPLEESSNLLPARSSSENDRVPKWLAFSNNETRRSYYNFLKTRSSKKIMFWVNILISFFVLFMNGMAGYNDSNLEVAVFVIRKARIIVCAISWVHYYHLLKDSDNFTTSKLWDLRNLVVSGNSILIINSFLGGLLLVVQCMIVCDSRVDPRLCNKYRDLNEMPWMNVIVNIFGLSLLPLVVKLHSSIALIVSWCLSVVAMVVASYIVEDRSNVVILSIFYLFVLLSMYERKRETITMFLTLRDKAQYYEESLTRQHEQIAIEFEKSQLQDMIGNVAHDLKTPLQAFMSELSGLQIEVNDMSSQLRDLQAIVSRDDDCTENELRKRVLAQVNVLTSSVSEANKYLESLHDIYAFMIMAINRAIEFRKSAKGSKLLPVYETFNLLESVQWAAAKFANNPSGVEVKVESHPNCSSMCPAIMSDKHWLSENILCLTSNACKFTSVGSIAIRCSIVVDNDNLMKPTDISTFDSQVLVSIVDNVDSRFSPVDFAAMTSDADASKFILVEVEDSGMGILPDKRHCLFRPFGHTQQRSGGTGLGLYSLSKRMEAIGGQCGMCNRRDGLPGSRFWFSIPYVPDTNSFQSRQSVQSKRTNDCGILAVTSYDADITDNGGVVGPSVHEMEYGLVLLVDDSALILKTTKRMLEKEGYEVKVAQNGAESLALMKENHYQFVLTDIQMPLMDGLEATRLIREFEMNCRRDKCSFQSQCIIGMSADSSVETKSQALSCGMDAFLPKPVHMSKLRMLLAEMAAEKC